VSAEPGTGPRHLLRTADGALLLVGELAGELSWFRRGADGKLARAGREVTSSGKPNQPSEVLTGRDGRFVYVGNRGPDTVSVFAWDGDGATAVAEVATGGEWPRHLALVSDHLYVANERSHNVTIFRVDPDSGIPVTPGESAAVPSPTCILQARVRDEIA
jgi:6-phosphogluconolactonase